MQEQTFLQEQFIFMELRIVNQGGLMAIGAWIKGILVSIATAIGLMSPVITKQDDGPIEEVAEEIIKEQTGIDIDFTPRSPEKK